ncbi:uncharacterized protein V1513DRAFT_435313 [Lipomyces chichibuensis]|uniref:uncharacterized protein n=1 Tax=Lipomyces chichibuensis TaxID=1546026 RepID=UPI0033436600
MDISHRLQYTPFLYMLASFRHFKISAFLRAIHPTRGLSKQITIVLILSLLNVNLNYPLYEPRRYQPVLYGSLLSKQLKVDMAVQKETANLKLDLYNSTSSNFTKIANAINGTHYNVTETAPAVVTITSYLITPDGVVDVYEHDGSDGLEDAKDNLLHIILPLSIFTAIGLLGLAAYLYSSMKKYMKEAICNAVISQELEDSRKAWNNNRGSNQDADSSNSIPLQKPPAAHIKGKLDSLLADDSLEDIEKDGLNGCDCSYEDVGNRYVRNYSNKLGRAWHWLSTSARGDYNSRLDAE